MSCVYLICFSRPLAHASHYIGFSRDAHPLKRFALHEAGRSRVPMIRHAVQSGIALSLTRVWSAAGRTFERRLKNQKNSRLLCPRCSGATAWGRAVHPMRRKRVKWVVAALVETHSRSVAHLQPLTDRWFEVPPRVRSLTPSVSSESR